MDLVRWGVPLIEWLQASGWLHGPARLFTALGDVQFMILWIPVVAWSIDRRLGRRLLLAMLAWGALNTIAKSLVGLPRPYWVEASVVPLAAEGSFGFPSGHAAYATAVWGTLALVVQRRWVRWLAAGMILGIGASRVVLGVHWPADVLGGWVLGAMVAVAVVWLDRDGGPIANRFSRVRAVRFAVVAQVAVLPLAMAILLTRGAGELDPGWLQLAARAGEAPDPSSVLGAAVLCGGLAGMLIGLLSSAGRPNEGLESMSTSILVLRSMVGLALVIIVSGGLGSLVDEGSNRSAPIAWALGAVVAWWVVDGAPRAFARMGMEGQSAAKARR